jgi:hypothetical protein
MEESICINLEAITQSEILDKYHMTQG